MSSIPAAMPADTFEDAHLFVNFQTGTVELDGKAIRMPNKEYALLAYLLRRARELVTRDELLMTIWNYGPGVRTRTLDVHIRRLRQNLEPYGKIYIETVFATGYRFQPVAHRRAEPTPLVAGSVESAPDSQVWGWSHLA